MPEPVLIKPNSSKVQGRVTSGGRVAGMVGSLYLVPPLYGQIELSAGIYPPSPTSWGTTPYRTFIEALTGWTTPGVGELNGFTYSGGRLTALASGRYLVSYGAGYSSPLSYGAYMAGVSINSAQPLPVSWNRNHNSVGTYKQDVIAQTCELHVNAGETVSLAVLNLSTTHVFLVYEATLTIKSVNL